MAAMRVAAAGRRDLADEVTAEAFARLLASYDSVREPQAWLFRTGYRLLPTSIVGSDVGRRSSEPTAEMAQELDPELIDALATLAPEVRLCVFLHYYADLPVGEIARLTGSTRTAVKVRLHRARSQLRVALLMWGVCMSRWTELLQSVERAEPSPVVPARALARAAERAVADRPSWRPPRVLVFAMAATGVALVIVMLALAAHSGPSAPEPARPPFPAPPACAIATGASGVDCGPASAAIRTAGHWQVINQGSASTTPGFTSVSTPATVPPHYR